VRDQLGVVRSEFPHTFYGIAGTQVAIFFTPSKTGILILVSELQEH
jgi:hypothetical protein